MFVKETAFYALTLDAKGAIASLVSRGKQLVGARMPLFEVLLRDGGNARRLTSDEAGQVCLTAEGDETLMLSFSDFDGADIDFAVKARFSDERIEWFASAVNRSGLTVEWIVLPQLAVPNDLVRTGGSGRILLNINEGMLCEDVEMRQKTFGYFEPQYPSEGLMGLFPAVVESPFIAYYDDTVGVYLGAHDPNVGLKAVDFYPRDSGILLKLGYYPGKSAEEQTLAIPYPTVMHFFVGSWEDAADIYRAWFEEHKPEGMTKLSDASLPAWYTDSPLTVTYPVRGIHDTDKVVPNKLYPYKNALPYLDALADATDARLLVILMQWESTAPWAPPYMWPPFGGVEEFRAFIDALHERNHVFGVYCSGTGYTMQSNLNDYSGAERFEREHLKDIMCTAPDGSLPDSHICRDQRRGYDMCASQQFTADTLCDEAAKIASVGTDYIQVLDQNHGGTPYFCYSTKHGHPPVPGAWQIESMKKLLSQMHKTLGEKVVLGCESAAAETYIPYLRLSDNRFNLNLHCARAVPLYAYLYHEYVNNFSGNSVNSHLMTDMKRTPDVFFYRLAYSFAAGDLMTLIINENGEIVWNWGQKEFEEFPDRARTLSFIRNATALRRGFGKRFLVYGKMIKPCGVASESIPVYKPFFPDYANDYPKVVTTAWEADGEKMQLVINYTADETAVQLDLSQTAGAVRCDVNGTVIETLAGSEQTLTLAGGEIAVLMLK